MFSLPLLSPSSLSSPPSPPFLSLSLSATCVYLCVGVGVGVSVGVGVCTKCMGYLRRKEEVSDPVAGVTDVAYLVLYCWEEKLMTKATLMKENI